MVRPSVLRAVVACVVGFVVAGAGARAQTPNTPHATLLVDGQTGALSRVVGTTLTITLRGTPGQPVLLVQGIPAVVPVPLPDLAGALEADAPFIFHLDGLDAGHPLFPSSVIGPAGETTWHLPFAVPAGQSAITLQAAVGDPGGTTSGLRGTASVTISPAPAAPVPAFGPRLVRGPHLEQTLVTSTLMTVRLDQPAPIAIDIGTNGTTWPLTFSGAGAALDHTVLLSGLTAATTYRYRVRSGGTVLAEGPAFAFHTAPLTGSPSPVRWTAFGDTGTGTSSQMRVSSRITELDPTPDLGLLLGDLIYPNGEAEFYDDNFFLPYSSVLATRTLWPALGNHDTYTASGAGWFDAFHLPTATSTVENYYSFDYGNVHFVAFDSEQYLYAGSPMLTWLAADLAGTSQPWKVAFAHQPPYTGGTHPDNPTIQQLVVPILEAAGVDIVVCGHSHVMERSHLCAGGAVVQTSPSGMYTKTGAAAGALYVVCGTGGQSGSLMFNTPPHPLMAFQQGNVLGHVTFEVSGPVLRGWFQDDAGVTLDTFSLAKGADVRPPQATLAHSGSTPGEVVVVFDEPVQAGAGVGGGANPTNYVLDGATAAASVVLAGDLRSARATFAPLHVGVAHTITVSGVRDTAVPTNAMTTTVLPVRIDPWRRVVYPTRAWAALTSAAGATAGWTTRDFDDSTWTPATAPMGYGPPGLVATTLPMQNQFVTFYARENFLVEDPATVESARFAIDFDDGFVAYLNGVEIARRGIIPGQTVTTLARNHSSGEFETFFIPQVVRYLVPGRNVLAIEVHNSSLASSDCVMDCELALRGAAYAPALRSTVNGTSGVDHGTSATVSVAGPLNMHIDVPPAGILQPVQLSFSTDYRAFVGLGPALLAPETPFLNLMPTAGGSVDLNLATLPPSLAGVTIVVQAFQSAPDRASSAMTVIFVP